MAKAISPTSGQTYGIRRVCQVWRVPRSSFYAAQTPTSGSVSPAPPPARRGPKPAVTDAALLAAIRHDLDRSPFVNGLMRRVSMATRTSRLQRFPNDMSGRAGRNAIGFSTSSWR